VPIDASIYGNIRPYTMESPIDSASKALAFADASKKYRMDQDIQDVAAQTGGDPAKMSQALMARGHFAPAMQLQSQAAAQKKAQIDQQLKINEAVASDAMTLDQIWRQTLQATGGNKEAALQKVQPVYSQVRQRWAGMGHSLPESFDPDANFAGIGQAKEAIQYLKTLAPSVHMTDTGGSITPTNTNPLAGPVGPLPGTQPIAKTAPPGAPTELNRLMTERDAIPQGDPRRAQYDKVITDYKAGRGSQNVTVNTGPMTPGKTAGNKVDEDLLGVTRNLMQLDAISSQFKPEYQRFQDKIGFEALKIKDSSVGLNNKEKKDLTEYSQYRRNAFNTLNEYIKSITGAAMTNAEADRILKGLPSPGTGLFDGDSPTEFKAKLDDAVQKTKMSVARLAYMKRNGMSLEDGQGNAIVPLGRMPQLINERGKAIESELKAKEPNVTEKALQRAVRRQLGVEFGLVAD
jgi:hypothetical protein